MEVEMAKSSMRLDDLVLISVDDHLIEPPDLFSKHFPARLKDRAPVNVRKQGKDVWLFEGKTYSANGLNAVVGRPRDEYGMEPTAFAEMRKGCYDVHARIDDMNANGVLASLCFPTFPHFAGERFFETKDREVALAAIRAYNDWHILDWSGAYPGRFIPLALLPIWDMNRTVEEVKRVVALGCHAVSFPDNPALVGFPSIHSEYWEPLWKVCNDNRVVLNCHIGTGSKAAHASDLSPIDAWITSMPISIANSAADWTFASFWARYPDLKMALSEGGIGWIPYFLERADFTYEHHRAWTLSNFGKQKPSEIFKEHILCCFIDDQFGLKNLDAIGEDIVAWECDYPHSDALWPESPEFAWAAMQNLSTATIDKITHLNVMREYSFDPFSILGREQCTVGALRARAAHVDTKPVAGMGGFRPAPAQHRVTSGDVLGMFVKAHSAD